MGQIKLADKSLDCGAFYIYRPAEFVRKDYEYLVRTAQLLSCIPEFTEQLIAIRQRHGIQILAPNHYMEAKTLMLDMEKYHDIIHTTPLRTDKAFVNDLVDLLKTRRLGPEWADYLIFLLFTERLTILYSPSLEVYGPKEIPRLRNSYDLVHKYFDEQPEINIVIRRQVAMTSLLKLIRANYRLKRSMPRLPKFPSTRVEPATMVWGSRIWAEVNYHAKHQLNYVKIEGSLAKLYKNEAVPDRLELARLFKHFYSALQDHL